MHLIVGPTMQKDVCSSCDPLDSSPLQLPGIVSGQTRSWNQSTVWVWQIHRLKGISSREFWAPQFSKGWGCCFFLLSNGLSGATDSQHEQLRRHAAGTLFLASLEQRGCLAPENQGEAGIAHGAPAWLMGQAMSSHLRNSLRALRLCAPRGNKWIWIVQGEMSHSFGGRHTPQTSIWLK